MCVYAYGIKHPQITTFHPHLFSPSNPAPPPKKQGSGHIFQHKIHSPPTSFITKNNPKITPFITKNTHSPTPFIIKKTLKQGSGHISLDARVNLTDVLIRSPRLLSGGPGPTPLTAAGYGGGGNGAGSSPFNPPPITTTTAAAAGNSGNGDGAGSSTKIKTSKDVAASSSYDPIRDFVPPGPQTVERYSDVVERLLGRFVSPQFFSSSSSSSAAADGGGDGGEFCSF